jgi:hypothetical protein
VLQEVNMPHGTKLEELLENPEADGQSFFAGGFWNNIIDLTLTGLTVLASLVATGLAAVNSKQIAGWEIAIVAGIPAAAASVQKIVAVRERSNWYFMYAAQVRSLATRLKFADAPNVEDIANERARLEIKMEADWTKIGSSIGILRRDNKKPTI